VALITAWLGRVSTSIVGMIATPPMNSRPRRRAAWPLLPASWPWPLPALVAWALSWAVAGSSAQLFGHALGAGGALLAGTAFGALAALAVRGPWRRGWVAAGFPLSALALGLAGDVPAWVWALGLAPLLLAYPLRAWRDAPFFPTPPGALSGMAEHVKAPARVLEAGCGLGHGLAELRRIWPAACLHGVEWSPLLAAVARWRRRDAQVSRGDLWRTPWAGYELVYLFQRPESMPRAWAKASAEMQPGSWLASLEFAVPDVMPTASLPGAQGRPVWLYRLGDAAGAASTPPVPGR
jgi:SAM-dependent methyltransferase